MIKSPHWDQGRGQKLIENVPASLLSYIIKTTVKCTRRDLRNAARCLYLQILITQVLLATQLSWIDTLVLIYSVKLAPVTLGIFCHFNRSILRNCGNRHNGIENNLTDLCFNNDARECAYKCVPPLRFLGCKKTLRLRDPVRQMAYSICYICGGSEGGVF